MHPDELGVEKNCRNTTKQPKTNNVILPTVINNDVNKLKSSTMLDEVVKSAPSDYMKYEFPLTSNQELDYTLDYTRYPSPLNLNMKKPSFMQQSNINHLTGFTSDVHSDVSKVHHFLSYT